jgi:hypothetical protein
MIRRMTRPQQRPSDASVVKGAASGSLLTRAAVYHVLDTARRLTIVSASRLARIDGTPDHERLRTAEPRHEEPRYSGAFRDLPRFSKVS